MATKRTTPSRQDTFRVHLWVADGNDKLQDTGVWDKKTGGDLDSNELTYMPGGMAPRISLGGQQLPSNITLQREYDIVDDHRKIANLLNAVGKRRIQVTQMPLDFNGHVYDNTKSIHWFGTLKRVLVPDVDSEANAAAMIEVECTIGSAPSYG